MSGIRCLVVGTGGVGSVMAAALAAASPAAITLFDAQPADPDALAARLREHYTWIDVRAGSSNPAGRMNCVP